MGAGFGTLMVQLSSGHDGDAAVRVEPRVPPRRAARRCTPTATSGCASWARSSRVLDPIVAVLDALPEHFDPDYAPRHVLNLLSAWLGVDARRVAADRRPARHDPAGRRARPPARHEGRPGARAVARVPRRAAARGGRGRGRLVDRRRTLWNQNRRNSSCTATSPSTRRPKPPSHVALSSSSRYTPPTGCASSAPKKKPPES